MRTPHKVKLMNGNSINIQFKFKLKFTCKQINESPWMVWVMRMKERTFILNQIQMTRHIKIKKIMVY